MSAVENEYDAQINAMPIAEKMERSAAMLKWTREMLVRQIRAEDRAVSDEGLRW